MEHPERDDGAASERGFVVVAEVLRPHGLQGELRLKIYNPDSEVLRQNPPVELISADGRVRPATILSARPVSGGLLVRLEGVDDREDADQLRGAKLQVPRTVLEEPGPDEYYVCDLVGCQVVLGDRTIGTIKRVVPYPTCDALAVERAGEEDLEIPHHHDFVLQVRIDEAVVELRTIEGLE